MKPWLKIDVMKAEALSKANRLTAERFRKDVALRKAYEQAIAEGKTAAEAVKKSGGDLGHASAHVRGWFVSLSLDESVDDGKWRWRASVSESLTIGAVRDQLDLKEIVERLGGKFDEPLLTPDRDGTKATHWRWEYVS